MAKRVFTQTFAVAGAIIEEDGKILLVKEGQIKRADAGKWNHPAGWVEVGENPLETVKKEIQEETGYRFTTTYIMGIYSLVREDLLKVGEEIHHPVKIIFIGDISKNKKKQFSRRCSRSKMVYTGRNRGDGFQNP